VSHSHGINGNLKFSINAYIQTYPRAVIARNEAISYRELNQLDCFVVPPRNDNSHVGEKI